MGVSQDPAPQRKKPGPKPGSRRPGYWAISDSFAESKNLPGWWGAEGTPPPQARSSAASAEAAANIRPLRRSEQQAQDPSTKIPGDNEAEQGVLGCILEHAVDVLPKVRAILSPDDFGRPAHRVIYRVICQMADQGDPVDITTVPIELRRQGKLSDLDEIGYVTSLVNNIRSTYDAEYFARTIKDAATARRVIEWGAQVVALGYSNASSAQLVSAVDEMNTKLHEQSGALGARRFGILSDMEMEQMRPTSGILGNWIRDQEIVAVYGASGSYKTFLGISMGGSMATGLDWFGMPTEQRTVLYIAAEAPSTIGERLAAWKAHHGITGQRIEFYTSTQPVNLESIEEVTQLIHEVRELLPDAPGAIVIDTYACATTGDEKDSTSVNAAYRGMRMLRDAFGAAIIFIDHEGKDREKGQTGSQRKKDNADVQIHVERIAESDGMISVEASKMKADEPPSPLTLQVKRVPYYNTQAQDLRHSLVLINVSKEDARAASKEARSKRLPRRSREALDALTDLPGGRATYGDWLRACRKGDPKQFPKSSFDDARDNLTRNHLIQLDGDDYVSLVRNENRTNTPVHIRTSTVGTGGIYTPYQTVPDVPTEAEIASPERPLRSGERTAEPYTGVGQTAPYHRHDPKTMVTRNDGITVCDDCHPRQRPIKPPDAR